LGGGMKKILLFVITIGLLLGCAGKDLISLKILTGNPMDNTIIDIYPEIEAVYESDNEIILICSWENVIESENHIIRWEIYNQKGDMVYTSESENVSVRPYLYYNTIVYLTNKLKVSLISGTLTVKLFFDGDLVKTKV
jgi:hypothetical protein